ncbi:MULTISPECIES: helix-turn-helix transcriptional regulator [unclassified Myroides]|uniref:helix-turn-helix transcriptional regulator n=1 Tax=unclassified Myroides TaxID=2642485 RepID=UPI0015F8CA7C|nr:MULTISPECIES: helix-turn-helix transcriptional regulator [unclassified Myroides]MBB1149797.1 helix-turn-helix transcriptional regulator [Myroides sp. NP-2]MDM1408980.1 helix-turn-helix transcriptional regulator [Myroides sp. DF42-4-2]
MDKIQRINEAIKWLVFEGLAKNHTDLAHKLGYKKSSFSQIINGRVNISTSFINRLVTFAPILNRKWLLNGEGSLFLSQPKIVQEEVLKGHFRGINLLMENDATYCSKSEIPEFLYNKRGNTFVFYQGGKMNIEVFKVPFSSHNTYISSFSDATALRSHFASVDFSIDYFELGYYQAFEISGDTMNGGNIEDTPDGAEVLAREINKDLWQGGFKPTKYGFILVTKDHILHKDITNYSENTGLLQLSSRNVNYGVMEYPLEEVLQIFHVIKRFF